MWVFYWKYLTLLFGIVCGLVWCNKHQRIQEVSQEWTIQWHMKNWVQDTERRNTKTKHIKLKRWIWKKNESKLGWSRRVSSSYFEKRSIVLLIAQTSTSFVGDRGNNDRSLKTVWINSLLISRIVDLTMNDISLSKPFEYRLVLN